MNAARLAIAAISLLGVPCADAQNLPRQLYQNPAPDAIPAFNWQAYGNPDGIPNTRDAAGTPTGARDEAKPETAADPDPRATDHHPESAHPSAPTPRPGMAVRVEKLRSTTLNIDPAKVKLRAPFPAKPLSAIPAGWCLKSAQDAPPFTREVELSPGNTITLTVRPQILVPNADGTAVFNLPEPGYDPSLGYRQNATVGAILAHSIRQLDDDSKELGRAIDKLQQLLVSLPKPDPQAESNPQPKHSNKR